MEPKDDEKPEEELKELTVDFSKQELRKIERANQEQQSAVSLILDDNEIQRLENLNSYSNLKKLSVANNQIVRMASVLHLKHLVVLDLTNNSIPAIEGLKSLKDLKHLILAKNRIKVFDQLSHNLKLEKLDLSENNITRISDISCLENLKELNLHGNRINYLTQCAKKLPNHLEVLTLNNNALTDLNEISHLANLSFLRDLSVANNPCLDYSEDQNFNYRPFVKNWCCSLVVLDNRPLDDIECLKAEWLYSQGRGRSFRPGEHAALVEYLNSVCPKEVEKTEDVKKLKLILSKAQLHQQQLREQLSVIGKFSGEDTVKSSVTRKKTGAPERMVTSFQDTSSKDFINSPDRMSQSLDSDMTRKSSFKTTKTELHQTPLQTSTRFIPIPDTLSSPDVGYRPRPSLSSRTSRSSSRNSPHSTPESKRKTSLLRKHGENSTFNFVKKHDKFNFSRSVADPLEGNINFPSKNVDSPGIKASKSRDTHRNCRGTSEDDDSEILALQLKTVQQRANQRKQSKFNSIECNKNNAEASECFLSKNPRNVERNLAYGDVWKAAVCIQRWWRGYRARNLNKEVLAGCKNIQMNRMQDYITKVVKDMEATRVALEGNRKLVVLQMQAINALWKKMTTLQPAVSSQSEDKVSLQSLVETCSALNKQVEGLQTMMKTMQASLGGGTPIQMATQTEIVAVHTPQDSREKFPYNSIENRLAAESVELEEKKLRENSVDSDSSTSGTAKTVTEIYTNCSIKYSAETSNSKSIDQSKVSSEEKLNKPDTKLNENCEVVLSPPEEPKESKEDPKLEPDPNS